MPTRRVASRFVTAFSCEIPQIWIELELESQWRTCEMPFDLDYESASLNIQVGRVHELGVTCHACHVHQENVKKLNRA